MIFPEWRGIYPAITTQFDVHDRVDYNAFFSNLDFQCRANIDGVILCGSLGEASTLSDDEKTELLRRTVGRIGARIPVVFNIAEQTTRKAAWFAEHAEQIGASGLMLLPPMRYKADERETLAFLESVAAASSLPILLYNNPVDYGIEITMHMFERLLKLDNVRAVKESTRNPTNVTLLRKAFGNRLSILCGVDTLAFEELVLGADGWVAGLVNAFPQETVAIYRYIHAGHIDDARAIHEWFLPLLELDLHPKLVQYIKLAETIVGVGNERVRAPRLGLEGSERREIEQIVQSALEARHALPTPPLPSYP